MKNFFRCYKCGVLNVLGDAACNKCGARFQYHCPACQAEIKGGDAVCTKCGNTLSWPFKEGSEKTGDGGKEARLKGGKHAAWIVPLLGLVLTAVIIASGIFTYISLTEKPQSPPVFDNATSGQKHEETGLYRSPLQISDIVVDNLSSTDVEIKWVTDKPSSSQVLWNPEGEPYSPTPQIEALVKEHSILLTGLKPNTTYYFKVRSVDQFNNEAVSEQRSFDLGKPGVAKIEVYRHSMTVDDQPKPVGMRTYVKGQLINKGDLPVLISNIRVTIIATVPGKTDTGPVAATLDPYPAELKPGETDNFMAVVPNGSQPDYTITIEVLSNR